MQEQKLQQRELHLVRLARAIYESALHEEDAGRLELHRLLAVSAASLFNEAINEDNLLHPDLGIELVLFIELKARGNSEAKTDRLEVLRIIEELEAKVKTVS